MKTNKFNFIHILASVLYLTTLVIILIYLWQNWQV